MTHAHRGLVAIWAGTPDKSGARAFSSGLLIAPRLVLTARHGVTKDGSVLPGVEVAFAAGSRRGLVRLTEPVPGNVSWVGPGRLDVALIELPEQAKVPADFVPDDLVWGEPVGTAPVEVRVTGMPGFAAAATGESAEVETARGDLEPDTYTASDRYAVNVRSWPDAWQDWQGISGAAVICAEGGYLVGVVPWSDRALAGRRLTAVPVRAFVGDPAFQSVLERHLSSVPDIEPVELFPFLARPRQAGSIGALLRPDAGLTAFTGREPELAELQRWRDERAAGPDVKLLLITGRGGEGKTRLALEFLARSKRDGWTGGLLKSGASATAAGPPQVVRHPGMPPLLIFDYAAARTGEIAALARAAARARPPVPVRLLLLARAAEDWWRELVNELYDELPDLRRDEQAALRRPSLLRPLKPLLTAASGATDPAAMFTATAVSLAPHLASFTGRTAAQLGEIAAQVAVPPLASEGSGHVLTVQMAALAELLTAAAPLAATPDRDSPVRGLAPADLPPSNAKSPEIILLDHEQRYRDKLADAQPQVRKLGRYRDRAVVGAALFGARGPGQPDARDAASAMVAAAIPELSGIESRLRLVATWIADIYPADEPEPGADTEYWGPVLPDRLGEFLVIRLLAGEETIQDGAGSLLASLAARSDPAGVTRALLILSRAAEHDSDAAQWIARLVATDPEKTAGIAALVASYAENPAPLTDALAAQAKRTPEIFKEVQDQIFQRARDVTQNYKTTLREHNYNRRPTAILVDVYRALVSEDRCTYLPELASCLEKHAKRNFLDGWGDHADAIDSQGEAVEIYRELARQVRDTYLPHLAAALRRYADIVRDPYSNYSGMALGPSAEAVDIYRELADRNPDAYLLDFVRTLNWQESLLARFANRGFALILSEEAVAMSCELVRRDRDAYLSELAISLEYYARGLAQTGSRDGFVAVSSQARAVRDGVLPHDLPRLNRLPFELPSEKTYDVGDRYLPEIALALNHQAAALIKTTRRDEALSASNRAVSICRRLAAGNRKAHLPELARSLNANATYLALTGRHNDAFATFSEAIALCRELTKLNQNADLDELASSLHNYSVALTEAGQEVEALLVSAEALTAYRELAGRHHADRNTVSLVKCLLWHAKLMTAAGQVEKAVSAGAEGLELAATLSRPTRDSLSASIGKALQYAYRSDNERTEAVFRRITGNEFPDEWKQ